MTLKEKIAYREAMTEMAVESQTMFNHYEDEYSRVDAEIDKEFMKRIRENED